MALSQKLQLRQSHALVMTPQLMQAIKLLQLSNLDLVGYVESELERNPLLERTGEGEAEGEPPAPERDAAADDRPAADWTEGSFAAGGDVVAERPDGEVNGADDGEVVASRASADAAAGYTDWTGAGSGRQPDGDYNLEAFVSAERTLADHLAEQLVLAVADPARRLIGQDLIDLVDGAGYLTGELAQVAAQL